MYIVNPVRVNPTLVNPLCNTYFQVHYSTLSEEQCPPLYNTRLYLKGSKNAF